MSEQQVETITFNGIKFRRYPESEHHSHRCYYSPGGNHAKRGIRALHVEIWRSVHGDVPAGHHIHYADGNPLNNEIDNLVCVTAKEHVRLHWDEERSARARKHIDAIRPLASAWHRSDAGRAWHSEHAKQIWWRDRQPVTMHCEECGAEFDTLLPRHARFCSNACKARWRRKSGVDNETRHCERCGAEFTSNKYDKVRFCSRSCGSRYWRETC